MLSRTTAFALLLMATPFVVHATTNRFLILNDLHYDPTYYTRQESCVEHIPEDELPKYSSFDCEPNWELVQNAVQALGTKKSPKFLVWLGDNTHHARNYSNTVLTPDLVIEVISNITRLLDTTFPGIPIIPVLGNHDYFPKDQLPVQNDASSPVDPIYNALGDLWTPWIGSDEEVVRFKKGGYYTRVVDVANKLRVMVLNTNLYLPKNGATEGMTDPGGQYAWTEQTLRQARADGEKVMFIIHVPVGFDENRESYNFLRDADNDRIAAVIRTYSDVIVGVFSGHAHTDTYKMIYNEAGEPVSTIFLSPALSPWRTFWNFASRNPAFREVMYEDQDWTLQDITQFYLKLEEANASPGTNAVWNTEYSFQQAYGLQSITPEKMHSLLKGFKEYGSGKFHDYYKYNTVSVLRDPCSCHCKSLHVCAIEAVQQAKYEDCLDEQAAVCGAYGLVSSIFTLCFTILAYFMFSV